MPAKPFKIPPLFYSIETNQPFEHCSSCGIELMNGNVNYFVEKAFKQYPEYSTRDVVFEYAVCFPCAMKVRQEISKESLTNLDNYFSTSLRFDPGQNQEEELINRCAVKGTPVAELTEFQMVAHCTGNQLMPGYMPFLIGGEAIDEMGNLLSNQTTDEMNRFIDNFSGLPPELKDLIKDIKPVLV